ncbi:MAG: YSC84-related protein [Betaproteobacteria bacterium]
MALPSALSPPVLQTNQRLTDTASISDRAIGPIGAGANADITADLIAFSRSKGVYGGLNLNGTVVSVADNWNQAYYGRSVTPRYSDDGEGAQSERRPAGRCNQPRGRRRQDKSALTQLMRPRSRRK